MIMIMTAFNDLGASSLSFFSFSRIDDFDSKRVESSFSFFCFFCA